MSKFTDRLWREIVREHGPELAQLESPSAGSRRRTRPRLLAGTGAGAAALAGVVAVIVSAASSAPAFAVTHNRDGTYTVQLHSLNAIGAANRTLRGMRVHAEFVAVNAGCKAGAVSWSSARATPALAHARLLAAAARLDPRRIPAGGTLVIPAMRVGHDVRVWQVTVNSRVVGGSPACLPPPCPTHIVAPTGNSGSTTTGNSGSTTTGNSGSTTSTTGSGSGNSANSGNSGSTTSTAASQTVLKQAPIGQVATIAPTTRPQVMHLTQLVAAACRGAAPAAGSSGSSGNSGNSGNSGTASSSSTNS